MIITHCIQVLKGHAVSHKYKYAQLVQLCTNLKMHIFFEEGSLPIVLSIMDHAGIELTESRDPLVLTVLGLKVCITTRGFKR